MDTFLLYLRWKDLQTTIRGTMACSRLRMHDWAEKYTAILVRSSIYLYLPPKNYVDDVRQGNDKIESDIRYDKDTKCMSYK